MAPIEYNYRDLHELGPDRQGWTGEMHGLSAFLRCGDRVFHTYPSYAQGDSLPIALELGITCPFAAVLRTLAVTGFGKLE